MPESPEVQSLVEFLDDRLKGLRLEEIDLVEFRALKTTSRPPTELVGSRVVDVLRYGKHVDLHLDAGDLVISLGRHGWVRWLDPGAGPIEAAGAAPTLASLTFDDGGVLQVTDAGTWVSIGLSVVDDPFDVASIAKLGPDPAGPSFTRADLERAVHGRRKQLKALLQEQESIAGIGNAYSDEILHAARLSPLAHASALGDEELDRLYDAVTEIIRGAVEERRGVPIDRLKAAKVAAMSVHGRSGQPCPVCGGTIRDVAISGTTAQYCPTCQTGGTPL